MPGRGGLNRADRAAVRDDEHLAARDERRRSRRTRRDTRVGHLCVGLAVRPSPRRRRASAGTPPGSALDLGRGSGRPRPPTSTSRRSSTATGSSPGVHRRQPPCPAPAGAGSSRSRSAPPTSASSSASASACRRPRSVQRPVAVALEAVGGVPVALAVAGEVDGRHSGSRRMTASSPALKARRRSSSAGSTMCPSRPM